MKFYLFTKFKDQESLVAAYLNKIGEVVSSILECDLIVSVGGDGTLLTNGKIAIANNKPIVGINAGHLGYLCAFTLDNLPNLSLKDFGELKESKRTLLEYKDYVAINDICVLKENPAQSIEVDVENIASWKGDGVIVCTATGSSAYNQAAGGPMINKESTDIVVTPICPHFAEKGSEIIKDNQVVINVSNRKSAVLSVDNQNLGHIEGRVVITKSDKKLRLLTK